MSTAAVVTKKPKPRSQRRPSPPPSSSDENEGESDENRSDSDEQEDDINETRTQIRGRKSTKLNDSTKDFSEDEDKNGKYASSAKTRSIKVKDKQESSRDKTPSSPKTTSKPDSNLWKYIVPISAILVIGMFYFFSNGSSDSPSDDNNWRLKLDPNDKLSNNQQLVLRASLKPILDKSSTNEGVSTLLILSSDENSAAKLARCLLKLVNTETRKAQVLTEIDLKSHRGGKLQLDSNLKSLLSPGGAIRAVLLRHIDDNSSDDTFERARLLFAYCDGENPVIPHRLIIMTATSNSNNESELREQFKIRWPTEHDFIDALMSRISGHTLYVEKDQKSIC